MTAQDPYFAIREVLTAGIEGKGENWEAWEKVYEAPSFQSLMKATFTHLNQKRATGRNRDSLSPPFWLNVNFIPDMEGPGMENLRMHAKALLAAADRDAIETMAAMNGLLDSMAH